MESNMSLIERLGGYEKAKRLGGDCKRYGRGDVKVPVNGGFIHIVADFLELDLLEYRRQHNIFEEGDELVEASYLDDTSNEIGIYDGKSFHGYTCVKFSETLVMADESDFRHATDEEIKAGRRL